MKLIIGIIFGLIAATVFSYRNMIGSAVYAALDGTNILGFMSLIGVGLLAIVTLPLAIVAIKIDTMFLTNREIGSNIQGFIMRFFVYWIFIGGGIGHLILNLFK